MQENGFFCSTITPNVAAKSGRTKNSNTFGQMVWRSHDVQPRCGHCCRLSCERRYYQKITDIYCECSSDYNKNSEETRSFFKAVQNMMHYAVTKQTAAEIIYDRADS